MLDTALIQKFYGVYLANRDKYLEIERYYNGFTDAMEKYKMQTERSNLKVHTNFLKKFIKEEVSYSVGNDITYISKSSDEKIIKIINEHFSNLSTQHDIELMKTMLKFNKAYELYYIDEDGEFKAKVISPLEGFLIKENNNIVAFGREYISRGREDTTYLDIYTNDAIFHYKVGEEYILTGKSQSNIFGFVPVGVAQLGFSDYSWCELVNDGVYDNSIYDTLFYDIKYLQDAYETNVSDLTNEISDFRNAYLTIVGGQLDETLIKDMKKLGILQSNSSDTKFEWLIKNLKSDFIQENLSNLEDKMYQISSHINHNEKMQSNLSGLALRSRLISLEEKCKLNQRGLTDCIRVRLKALFTWLNILQGTKYDWKDIKIKFTPNIPQDDLSAAQIIGQLGDKLSTETGLSLLSFVENPVNEAKKAKEEQQETIDNLPPMHNDNLEVSNNSGGNNVK
ncbi:MAG: phage portal protein [Bacillota bacterium]|nr:phage portal protein [Bacillota bacterium]